MATYLFIYLFIYCCVTMFRNSCHVVLDDMMVTKRVGKDVAESSPDIIGGAVVDSLDW